MRSGIALLHVARGNKKYAALMRAFGRNSSIVGHYSIALCMGRETIRGIMALCKYCRGEETQHYAAILRSSGPLSCARAFLKECQSAENKSHTAVTTLTLVGFHANRRARELSN